MLGFIPFLLYHMLASRISYEDNFVNERFFEEAIAQKASRRDVTQRTHIEPNGLRPKFMHGCHYIPCHGAPLEAIQNEKKKSFRQLMCKTLYHCCSPHIYARREREIALPLGPPGFNIGYRGLRGAWGENKNQTHHPRQVVHTSNIKARGLQGGTLSTSGVNDMKVVHDLVHKTEGDRLMK